MKRNFNIEIFDLIKGFDKIPMVSQLVTMLDYNISTQVECNCEMIAADYLTGILAICVISDKQTNKDIIDFLNLNKEAQKELFETNMKNVTKKSKEHLILCDYLDKGLTALKSNFPTKHNFSFFYFQKTTLDKLSNKIEIKNLSDKERFELAENPNTSSEILDKLSHDEEDYIRAAVASNPNTQIGAMFKLAHDYKINVRFIVAKNTSFEVILKKLSKDEEESVRSAVASNQNTSVEIFDKLSKDEKERVRDSVASNKNTSVEILDKLANDESKFVRYSVAENPNTSSEILDKLSNDNDRIRSRVVYNPNTSLETLNKLSNDESEYVRTIAAKQIVSKQ